MQQTTTQYFTKDEVRGTVLECIARAGQCVFRHCGVRQRGLTPIQLSAHVCRKYSNGECQTFDELHKQYGLANLITALTHPQNWAACGLERDVIEKCLGSSGK